MPQYTFDMLSDYEFEILVRDLLQHHMGLTLESFSRGRDGGIDLRCTRGAEGTLIVQCKHYLRSGYEKLRTAVKQEIHKIRALAPERYILATSHPLTPHQKLELLALLEPYCQEQSDIYGQEDLNNLLGHYPAIEQQHYKLWLTSVPVLQKVLHAGIFHESEAELHKTQRHVRLYVGNSSFDHASKILERHHYCLITGLPGTGKSTLAEILLLKYAQIGYETFRVWNINDARAVWDASRKQFFYFDDFLGSTRLDPLRDRDDRLLEFLEIVKRHPNSRFVLTTREYILGQAIKSSEKLAHSPLLLAKCVLDLGTYTRRIRAQILYNHIYFSDLPIAIKAAFHDPKMYRPIVEHRNFSPRIIEWMTQMLADRQWESTDYLNHFRRCLDDPQEVWRYAVEQGLSVAARHLLLTLVTLPGWVLDKDLKAAFEECHFNQAKKYNLTCSPYDFRNALHELEGSLIVTQQIGGSILISFHNASLRDFLEERLRKGEVDLLDLIETFMFPDQVNAMFHMLSRGLRTNTLLEGERVHRLLSALRRTFDRKSVRIHIYPNGDRFEVDTLSQAELYIVALSLWAHSRTQSLEPDIRALTDAFIISLENDPLQSRVELSRILAFLDVGLVPGEVKGGRLHRALIEAIVTIEDLWGLETDDLKIMVDVVFRDSSLVTHDAVAGISHAFQTHLSTALREIESHWDPDWMRRELAELEHMAEVLGVDLGEDASAIRDRIRGLIWEIEEERIEAENVAQTTTHNDDDEEIRMMFVELKRLDRPE